jgi:hypothetical protein
MLLKVGILKEKVLVYVNVNVGLISLFPSTGTEEDHDTRESKWPV